MNWFYVDGDSQRGPVEEQEIRRLLAEGVINQGTLLWREGMAQWSPLSQTEFGGSAPSVAGQAPNIPYVPQPIGYGAGQHVPNYLTQAILVTLFCCVPFGIVAIVYSAQVNPKLSVGDYIGARQASDKARMWCWWSFGIGLAAVAFYVAMAFIGGFHA